MKLNPVKVSFGRHETFPLRFGWLPKGFQGLQRDVKLFENPDEATVRLGVGKNMVQSIRYWLRATQVLDQQSYQTTELGRRLLDDAAGEAWDPYLEDEGTIWLLHWLLASNSETSTAWFWFFNNFHKPLFTALEVQTALRDFVADNVSAKVATSTLKADVAVLLRMYVQSPGSARTSLEDALDSPLSLLGLIEQQQSSKQYLSKPQQQSSLPTRILAYAIADLFGAREAQAIPLEELMYSRQGYAAPGAVFRLTEASLVSLIERMVDLYPRHFTIRETAGIHQLYQLERLEGLEVLNDYFQEQAVGDAA